jgi:hypothetical protein
MIEDRAAWICYVVVTKFDAGAVAENLAAGGWLL